MNYLFSGWQIPAKNLKEFEELQNDLSGHTDCEKLEFGDFSILSFNGINHEKGIVNVTIFNSSSPFERREALTESSGIALQAVKKLKDAVASHDKIRYDDLEKNLSVIEKVLQSTERIPSFNRQFISLKSMESSGITEETFLKLTKDVKFALYKEATGEVLFVSPMAWNTLVQRLSVGKDVSNTNNVIRDLYLASRMKTADSANFIIRRDGKTRVLVAAPSTRNGYFPQTEIQKIYGEIARTANIRYSYGYVGAADSVVGFDFPDEEKYIREKYGIDVVPGIEFRISDTCSTGIYVSQYYKVNGVRIYSPNCAHKEHRGKFTYEDVLAEIKRCRTMDFTEFPALLAKCGKIVITPPDADLTTEIGQSRNRNAVETAYMKCASAVDLKKSIGMRREEIIKEQIQSMDPGKQVTALDIVSGMMQIPEKIEDLATGKRLHPDLERALRKQLYSAVQYFSLNAAGT